MTGLRKLSLVLVTCSGIMAFSHVWRELQEPLMVDTRPAIQVMMPKLEAPKIEIDTKDHRSFLKKIGHYESGNDYAKVNKWGYMGKYQFGMETLDALGIETTKRKFLSSPTLQEEAMVKLLTDNKQTLRRYIRKYDGKVVHGVYVTESGILAAAHLGGAGNVMNWFKNGEDFKDANGTPITKYMTIFSGYNINLE